VNLFLSADELTSKAFNQAQGWIVTGKSVIIFVAGGYAAILFQDENEMEF
jgi:hypothetical protein